MEKSCFSFFTKVRILKYKTSPSPAGFGSRLGINLQFGQNRDIKCFQGCPESVAQQYFCQIIKAIDYCHKLHVVHRDLKVFLYIILNYIKLITIV